MSVADKILEDISKVQLDIHEMRQPNHHTEKDICRNAILNMMQEVCADTMQVFDFGATKHPDSGEMPNFLTEAGNKCSLKDRGSSILRHSARTFMRTNLKDEESNLPELLHLMASVAIMYVRQKRNIIHPEDKINAI